MTDTSRGVIVREGFDPIPSRARVADLAIAVGDQAPGGVVVGLAVASDGDVDPSVGFGREDLAAAGFKGTVGQTLVVPRAGGAPIVVYGIGVSGELDASRLRDAAGAFARAASGHDAVAIMLPDLGSISPEVAGTVVVEGVALARYAYDTLSKDPAAPLASLSIVARAADQGSVAAGAERGKTLAAAAAMARDLANTPPAHLTATRMGEVATSLAAECGFDVELFDRDDLIAMGCGGLLSVNGGSAEPPRMIKLTYQPASGTSRGQLTFVGKGIMYDSGGISLKPADGTHATMKNDMSGAGSVLAAMSALAALNCETSVTGYLMCTDNMLSGTALKMGDVITMRGGMTVEVMNTDAEGRLVMADALVLATEDGADAIVDIATLTGACLRALGPEMAGVMGSSQGLVDQIIAAGDVADEPLWQLPLARRYRKYLDSTIADIKNLGGEHAGAITAALFLVDFVGDIPWAHIDIAGPAQGDSENSWRTSGCTGFGTRVLIELALSFTKPD